jgi:hypothetical protein
MKPSENGWSPRDRERARAAYYALYLREAEGFSPDEAAVLVRERYPHVRIPELRVKKGDSNADHARATERER